MAIRRIVSEHVSREGAHEERIQREYRARLNRAIRRTIFGIRLAKACGMPQYETLHRETLVRLLRERATT